VELIGLPPAPVIDVEAIEAGLELEEGAVGGGEVVTTSRTVQSNDTVSDDP
jgi:nucleoid-associated protein YgaU